MDKIKLNRMHSINQRHHMLMLKITSPEVTPQQRHKLTRMAQLQFFHKATRLHDLPTRLDRLSKKRASEARLHKVEADSALRHSDPEIRLAIETLPNLPAMTQESIAALVHLLQSLKQNILSEDWQDSQSHSMLTVASPDRVSQTQLMVANPELEMIQSLLSLWLPQRSKDRHQSMN